MAPQGSLNTDDQAEVLDFAGPYKRLPVMETLNQKIGLELPQDLEHPSTPGILRSICTQADIKLPARANTSGAMVDWLIGELIEPDCIQPTFLIDHPKCLSPLAQTHRDNPNLTERFELFARRMELANAYTELNNPQEQRERFMAQAQAKQSGEQEAHCHDDNFVTALEYGLPPTAGWGMGIDRLCMLLLDQKNIREVVAFPMVKPEPTGS